jgi:serine/threonine-protein kinase
MRVGEIGGFTIVSKIGEGGMSVVYLAERASDRTPVVVKELKEQYRGNQQLVDRFRREAEILQNLRHPHLAKVFDVLLLEGKHYIVQEYLSGGSLADLIREKKPYSEKEAITWCRDALRAMNYAHENGIVHRDLKPSNLMLDDQRQVRVIDFGIARAFGSERLTRTGDGSIGTLEYMSPEQILRPNQIDHLTDVYSMGIVLYELLSGSVPFEGPTPFSVQEKIARQPPPPLRQLGRGIEPLRPNGGGIDSTLAKLVFKAIEKSPERRFGGCAEFALQLERYVKQPAPTPMRLAAIAAGMGVLITIFAFLVFQLSSGAGTPESNPPGQVIPAPAPEDPGRAEEERRLAEQKAEAERQAQLQKQQEADRLAQQKQQEADRQAQKQQEADRQAKLQKQQEADRQARLQKQLEDDRLAQLQKQEADRQAQLQKQRETDRLTQLLKQEADRQAQLKKQQQETDRQAQLLKQQQEADRQAQLLKQKQEADRQAQIQKQDAERQAQLQKEEAERLRRMEQQKAAAQFFQSVMGTWARDEDNKTEQSRVRIREVLNIGSDCSGVLTRTVTTYERGFAGWKEVDEQTSQFSIRCDATGRVSGDLTTQLLPQGRALLLGTNQFTRRK